jgi:hypothetical protein
MIQQAVEIFAVAELLQELLNVMSISKFPTGR